jgi:hypothetical protein
MRKRVIRSVRNSSTLLNSVEEESEDPSSTPCEFNGMQLIVIYNCKWTEKNLRPTRPTWARIESLQANCADARTPNSADIVPCLGPSINNPKDIEWIGYAGILLLNSNHYFILCIERSCKKRNGYGILSGARRVRSRKDPLTGERVSKRTPRWNYLVPFWVLAAVGCHATASPELQVLPVVKERKWARLGLGGGQGDEKQHRANV